MEIKKFDRFLFTALGPDLVRRRWATSVTVNVCDGLVFEPVVSVPGCDCFTVSAGMGRVSMAGRPVRQWLV